MCDCIISLMLGKAGVSGNIFASSNVDLFTFLDKNVPHTRQCLMLYVTVITVCSLATKLNRKRL